LAGDARLLELPSAPSIHDMAGGFGKAQLQQLNAMQEVYMSQVMLQRKNSKESESTGQTVSKGKFRAAL